MAEKTIRKFSSFEEAEKAEIELYKNMSYRDKLLEFFQILDSQTKANETEQRLQRVYKIIKLS
jgi:hypothetical protein